MHGTPPVGADLTHDGAVTHDRHADDAPAPEELGLPEHSALTMEGRLFAVVAVAVIAFLT